MRVKKKANGFTAEYVYVAETPDQNDRPKHGYGESWFTTSPARQNYPIGGHGYYLAAEEGDPFRCSYCLRRIDDEFKRLIGAKNESLELPTSMESFIQLADAYYKAKEETQSDNTDLQPKSRSSRKELRK